MAGPSATYGKRRGRSTTALQSPSILIPPSPASQQDEASSSSSSSEEEDSADEDGDEDGDGPSNHASGSASRAATQAHLTPRHNRPSRNRRPPAWLEDGLVEVPRKRSTSTSRASSAAAEAPKTPSRRARRATAAKAEESSSDDEEDEAPDTPSKSRAASGRSIRTRRKEAVEPPALSPRAKAVKATSTPARPIKKPRISQASSSSSKASPTTPRKRKPSSAASTPKQEPIVSKPFIRPTSADYYFAAHVSRRRSQKEPSWASNSKSASSSSDLGPLISKQVAKLSHPGPRSDPLSLSGLSDLALNHYRYQYPSWTSLLFLGNDLIFYGLGAKEVVLDDFARQTAERGEATVVAIKGRTGVRAEEWVESVEEALGIASASAMPGGIEGRIQRIVSLYDEQRTRRRSSSSLPHLILLLHALDSPSLLNPRNRAYLQLLSASPCVHLIGTVTHPNAAFLNDYTVSTSKGKLWIDCTTLLPHLDDCLLTGAGVKLAGLPRAFDLRAGGGVGGLTGMSGAAGHGGGGQDAGAGATSAAEMHSSNAANAPLLTATAALHVLKSVTVKARALFLKLSSELKGSQASTTVTPAGGAALPAGFASRSIAYTRLSHLATRNFIATSEPALRALLVEFTTHGLVRIWRSASGGEGGGGEERVSIGVEGEKEIEEIAEGVKKL